MQTSLPVLLLLCSIFLASRAHGQIEFIPQDARADHVSGLGPGAADFNRDGHLDLVVRFEPLDSYSDYIRALLGDGKGSFSSGREIMIPDLGIPTEQVTADFNLDGDPDTAVRIADYWDTSQTVGVMLFLGDGAGGFFTDGRQLTTLRSGYQILTADLNRDGFPDAALTNNDETRNFSIFFGNGAGFENRRDYDLGPSIEGPAAIADLDKDAIADLVFQSNEWLYFFRGNGDGTFTLMRSTPTGFVYSHKSPLLAVDVNSDGRLDITFAGERDKQSLIFVYRNDGGWQFGELTYPINLRYSTIEGLAAGDFDESGYPDLTVSHLDGVIILRNLGNEVFVTLPRTYGEPLYSSGAATTGDFVEDGHADLVIGPQHMDKYATSQAGVFDNCTFDFRGCKTGNVNGATGACADILSVNDSFGEDGTRIRRIGPNEPFMIRMDRPPSVPFPERAVFALYAWPGEPDESTVRVLPFGLGCSCMPTPLSNETPRCIWNNTGRLVLGNPTLPSDPAPSIVFAKGSGVGREVTFFLQGIIFDPASAAPVPASVTNGIIVRCR